MVDSSVGHDSKFVFFLQLQEANSKANYIFV